MCFVLGIAVILLIVVSFGVESLLFQFIWNYLVVSAFDINPITFWQSLVIIIVLNFIGSFFPSSVSVKN